MASPVSRLLLFLVVVLSLAGVAAQTQDTPVEPPPFDTWLDELVREARDRGYGDALIEQALADLEPLPRVIEADRSQAELNPGFARYLSTRLTPAMVRRGREMASTHRRLLGRIEARFDVQRRFVL